METAISSNPLIALNQLRSQNEELRNELRQVSQTLDDLLVKQAPPEPSNSSTEKRIESAQKLLAATEKELEILRQQLEAHSFENKHRLEDEIVSTKALLKETVNRNKEIQRELKEGANKINIQATDPEEAKEMRILNEELRVCKEKLKEIDAKYNHQKKQNENALTKIAQLERQAQELGINAETPLPSKKNKGYYEEEPEKLPLEYREIQALKDEISELEKIKLSVEPKWRKRLTEIEQEKGYYEESKENSNKLLKEKEQEIRMKEFEIKDLKRSIRNLRTKSGNLASAPDLNIEEKEEKPKKTQKFVGLPKSTKAKKHVEETKEEMKPVEKVKNQRKQNVEVEMEMEEEKPKARKISQERKEPKGHSHKRKHEDK